MSFRLTEDEYAKLLAVCSQEGAPTMSDFLRTTARRIVESAWGEGPLNARMAELDAKVAELDTNLRHVARTLSRLKEAHGKENADAS